MNRLICQPLWLTALLALWLPVSHTDLAAAANASASQPARRPNIVFIFADDWGWGDLGCHGSTWVKTPNLDRLAREGTDFHQFNVLNPVCSPSRTAAMTGQFPARWSVHQHFASLALNQAHEMPDWLDPRAPMLPRLLQQAGYRTGHFGKWHLTNVEVPDAPLPSAYGFDEWAVFNGPGQPAGLHDTAANAVKFIRAHKQHPFYLNVWLHETHTPHVPTDAALKQHTDLDEQKQVYAAVVTDGDNAVGEVLAALQETGLERNTLVIFSSDNGPESTGPAANRRHRANREQGWGTFYSVGETGGLRGRKRSLFEGGVRLPFIVRWPGRTPAGAVNKTTVFTAVDLLPTLCAVAGVSVPRDYRPDGENLLAALEGKEVTRTRPIFWEWRGNANPPDWWPRLAVRDGDWKLYLDLARDRVELYPLNLDRAEAHDVAAQHPDIVARLKQHVLAWKATLPASPKPDCISKARAAAPFPKRNP
jgi:arylsulfatase A-like enzyme